MKNIVLSFFALLALTAFRTDKLSNHIKFDKTTHYFGKIAKGIPVQASFIISNIGEEPVMINSIERQCGCTTPKFNKKPINKGESDTIVVGYNAAVPGAFTKKLTVKTNFGNTELYIRGTVSP